MNTTEENIRNNQTVDGGALPTVRFPKPQTSTDWATILGVLLTFGLIATAILISDSNANFFNVPSLLIVVFGTITATTISYSVSDMAKAGKIFTDSIVRKVWDVSALSSSLIDLAVISKKKGILSLAGYENEMGRNTFLARSIQLVVDGYTPENVERLLTNELEALNERHKRSAGIAQRGAEVAPAMGLIGTLVGLVQMLADLENPEALGPAMAVAILTTLYGAILGMITLASLAMKLESNAEDEVLVKTLILIATTSIAKQDNPRQLEMLLNAELPPDKRIKYFD